MSYVQYAEPYPHSRGDRFGATAGRANPHRGQDTAPGGLPVLAAADGHFVGVKWSPALGNTVVIRHADGKFTGYAHLANTNGVSPGKFIGRGQAFGLIGATGTAQRGRHLHYTLGNDEWGVFGGHVENPLTWINAHLNPQTYIVPAANGDPFAGDLYTAAEHDGLPGPVFYALAQRYSNRYFGTRLTVDGKIGPWTDKAIVRIVAADVNSKYAPDTSAARDGLRGKVYWRLVQQWHNQYRRPKVTVDGIPGPLTRASEVRIAAWHLNRTPGI